MFLDQQILAALRRALRENRLDAADHLMKAAEALIEEYKTDPAAQCRVSIKEVYGVVSDGLRCGPSEPRAHRKRVRWDATKH